MSTDTDLAKARGTGLMQLCSQRVWYVCVCVSSVEGLVRVCVCVSSVEGLVSVCVPSV